MNATKWRSEAAWNWVNLSSLSLDSIEHSTDIIKWKSEAASNWENLSSLSLDSMEHSMTTNSHAYDRNTQSCIVSTRNATCDQQNELYNNIEDFVFGMNENITNMEKAHEMVICAPASKSDPILNLWKARFLDPDNCYYKLSGVEESRSKANEFYRTAVDLNIEGMAQAGNQYAQFNLGLMYANGRGVSKDEIVAAYWFHRAAEQGHALSQVNVGVMYHDGMGVDNDDTTAAYWYRKVAKQGHAGGQYNLGLMYDYGNGVEKDEAKAVHWYRKAAEQGYAKAQFNLGFMYTNGKGVEEDESKAEHWYRKAAEQGYTNT